MVDRCGVIEAATMEIVQHARQQEVFNGSVGASIDRLETKVKIHQNNIDEVMKELQRGLPTKKIKAIDKHVKLDKHVKVELCEGKQPLVSSTTA